MRVKSKTASGMGLAFIKSMKLLMKDNGRKAKKKEKEKSFLRVEVYLKVILRTI